MPGKRFAVSTLIVTVTLLCSGQSTRIVNDCSTLVRGAVVGRLTIPRLHVSVVVLEGSDQNILAVAAGHIEGTSLPGRSGNAAIAAHRDTFFGSLRGIRRHDVITVTTMNGSFSYEVNRTEVVAPSHIEVLHPTTAPELTLVTCYPFRHNGPSPQRFIVHARRVSSRRRVSAPIPCNRGLFQSGNKTEQCPSNTRSTSVCAGS